MGTEVINNLDISGNCEDLKELRDLVRGTDAFDFDAVIPTPAELVESTDEIGGYDKLYEWRAKHWGTVAKVDTASGREFLPDGHGYVAEGRLWYSFRSYRGEPDKVIQRLTEKFVNVKIHHHFSDTLGEHVYDYYYENGDVVFRRESADMDYVYSTSVTPREDSERCEQEIQDQIDIYTKDPAVCEGRPTNCVRELLGKIERAKSQELLDPETHRSLKSQAELLLVNLRSINPKDGSTPADANIGKSDLGQYLWKILVHHDSRDTEEREELEKLRDCTGGIFHVTKELLSWHTNAMPMELCGRAADVIFHNMVRLQDLADKMDMDRCKTELPELPQPHVFVSDRK